MSYIYIWLVCIIDVCFAHDSSESLRGWLDHVRNLPLHLQQVKKESSDKAYKFEQKWFEQKLDHVNMQHHGTFWQRYFVYDKYSRNEVNYPLFVFCGAEQGDIYQEWDRYGFMVEFARKQGAKVLWLEHRFFGQSMPFGPDEAWKKRPDRVGLLSLEQSVADYAAIIRKYHGTGPVMTFGGSLSGTIAVMMRVRYPALVDMAFASSAPIIGAPGVADPNAWREQVTKNFAGFGGTDCPGMVKTGFAALSAPRDYDKLKKAFRPCEEDVSDSHWNAIFGRMWSHLDMLGTYVYPGAFHSIVPACERMRGGKALQTKEKGSLHVIAKDCDTTGGYRLMSKSECAKFAADKKKKVKYWGTVSWADAGQGCTERENGEVAFNDYTKTSQQNKYWHTVCKRLEESTGEVAFARLLRMSMGQADDGTCTNFTQLVAPGTENVYGQGWAYMACTEVIHPIGSNNQTDMFPVADWTVADLTAQCKYHWNTVPDPGYMLRAMELTISGTGANARVKRRPEVPNKVLLSYGEFDPWSTMVPRQGWADDVEIVKVPGGSHVSDLETPVAEDTEGMRRARETIEHVLSRWIHDLRPVRKMKVNIFGHNPSRNASRGKDII